VQFPLSSGQSAQFLGVTEPRLNELIRKGKLDPAPQSAAGRRLWWPEHLLAAAQAMNLPTDELRVRIEALPRSAQAEV